MIHVHHHHISLYATSRSHAGIGMQVIRNNTLLDTEQLLLLAAKAVIVQSGNEEWAWGPWYQVAGTELTQPITITGVDVTYINDLKRFVDAQVAIGGAGSETQVHMAEDGVLLTPIPVPARTRIAVKIKLKEPNTLAEVRLKCGPTPLGKS